MFNPSKTIICLSTQKLELTTFRSKQRRLLKPLHVMFLLKHTGVVINTIITKKTMKTDNVLPFMTTSTMIAIKLLEIIKSQSMIYKLTQT